MHHNQQIEALLFHGEYLQNVEIIVEFARVFRAMPLFLRPILILKLYPEWLHFDHRQD